jgi:hypothetical protein
MEHACAMLIAWDLPKFLWAEAVNYVVWLKNCLPSRSIPGHTSYALVHNEHLDLSLAHEFGSTVLVHVENAGKLESKADEALFIGIDTESKAYLVYWPTKRQVSVERNMTFVPQSVTVTDGVQAEGEYNPSPSMQSIYVQEPLQMNKNSPPAQPPSTPPRQTKAPETPPAPRPTRVRDPIG